MTPVQIQALLSSKSVEWGTPRYVFDFLQGSDPFTLDVCASEKNFKVSNYYSLERGQDALTLPWYGRWWCNPPYGKWLKLFAKYAVNQVKELGSIGTLLVPARVDTRWFDTLRRQAGTILFLQGRIPFLDESGVSGDPALFPCCVFEVVPEPPIRPLIDRVKLPKRPKAVA